MQLAEEIGKYRSVAIAGLAKNTGKTVTLNYLLREGQKIGLKLGVTSIGVDGESIDIVSQSRKPEIKLYDGMWFATSETHFLKRKLEAEISGIMPRGTSLGRVVTGRALSNGKMLLSGPGDTASMKGVIADLQKKGAETVLVDGALSRVSQASPAVTDALVLATGAALSPDIPTIVARTVYMCRLTCLPEAERVLVEKLDNLDNDIYAIDGNGSVRGLEVGSALNLSLLKERISFYGNTIFSPGLVSDRFLKFLSSRKEIKDFHLIIRDFTRLFVDPFTLKNFTDRGGRISVLKRPELLAVTINPYSPAGYTVNREKLEDALRERIDTRVEYIIPM